MSGTIGSRIGASMRANATNPLKKTQLAQAVGLFFGIPASIRFGHQWYHSTYPEYKEQCDRIEMDERGSKNVSTVKSIREARKEGVNAYRERIFHQQHSKRKGVDHLDGGGAHKYHESDALSSQNKRWRDQTEYGVSSFAKQKSKTEQRAEFVRQNSLTKKQAADELSKLNNAPAVAVAAAAE